MVVTPSGIEILFNKQEENAHHCIVVMPEGSVISSRPVSENKNSLILSTSSANRTVFRAVQLKNGGDIPIMVPST